MVSDVDDVSVAKGRFIPEKIDLLMQMCIVEPWLWALGRPRAVFAEQFASWDEATAGVVSRLEREKERQGTSTHSHSLTLVSSYSRSLVKTCEEALN